MPNVTTPAPITEAIVTETKVNSDRVTIALTAPTWQDDHFNPLVEVDAWTHSNWAPNVSASVNSNWAPDHRMAKGQAEIFAALLNEAMRLVRAELPTLVNQAQGLAEEKRRRHAQARLNAAKKALSDAQRKVDEAQAIYDAATTE